MMNRFVKSAVAATAFMATMVPASMAQAETLVVNINGAQSFDAFGDPNNTVLNFNIGANSLVTDFAYTLTLTTIGGSFLSEARIAFTATDTANGVFFTPGFADPNPGTETYSDSVSLEDLGLDFNVGADGLLRLEFFESFDDNPNLPDAIYTTGNLTFTYTPSGVPAVPEPASWAMMIAGFGLVGGAMRRRQSTTVAYA